MNKISRRAWARQSRTLNAVKPSDEYLISVRADVAKLTTREQCLTVMRDCDRQSASIVAKKSGASTGLLDELEAARRRVGLRRAMTQERLGEINREERRKRGENVNQQFIDAAMRVLPQATVQMIWDDLHRHERMAEENTHV